MKEIIILILAVSVPTAFAQEYQELGVRVVTVAEDLEVPWSIAWTPDGTILFTERIGHLRVVHDGILQEKPVLTLDVAGVEGGLLGIAVDPDYSENNYIYLYYTYDEFITRENKVVRYVYSDGEISEDKTIIDGISGGPFHDGGRIKFGPDGKLYITTGDAGLPELSQDMDSLGGKILRINPDGTIPHDNPFPGSAVYSYGHRNPQGIDWDELGNLVSTEHGPSGWLGVGHDEINLITPGSNYGWPDVIGDDMQEGTVDPILHTGSKTWAPSGATFYNSETITQWIGKYFVATLRGSHLHMFDLDLENRIVLSHERLFDGEFGRLRDVAVGPDGNLYMLTSNRDGRGSPQINDDRILKIMPMKVASFEECVAAGNPIAESHPPQCITQDGLRFTQISENRLCDAVSGENPIFVTTNFDSYNIGDVLLVEGCADSVGFDKVDVTIQNPDGEIVAEWSIFTDEDGTFSREVAVDETMFLVNGSYSVVGSVDGQYYSKTFTVPEFGLIIPLVLAAGLLMVLFQRRLFGRVSMASNL